MCKTSAGESDGGFQRDEECPFSSQLHEALVEREEVRFQNVLSGTQPTVTQTQNGCHGRSILNYILKWLCYSCDTMSTLVCVCGRYLLAMFGVCVV